MLCNWDNRTKGRFKLYLKHLNQDLPWQKFKDYFINMRSVKDLNLQSMSVIKGKEIEEVYSDWKKALMCNDLAFLEQVYSDDFTLTNSTGIIKNKSEVLTRLGFKDIQYLFWEDKDVLIDIKGDNAILKSYQTLNIELYNLPIKIDRKIILTFEKRNDVWILKNIEESSN